MNKIVHNGIIYVPVLVKESEWEYARCTNCSFADPDEFGDDFCDEIDCYSCHGRRAYYYIESPVQRHRVREIIEKHLYLKEEL